MHPLVERAQPPVSSDEHPVGQGLPGESDPEPFELLLLLAVERQTLHELLGHYVGDGRGRSQAPRNHGRRHRRRDDGSSDLLSLTVPAAIDVANMLDHFRLSRDDLKFLPNFRTHLVQWATASRADLVGLRETVLNGLHRKVFEHGFTMAAGLATAIRVDRLQRRFRRSWAGCFDLGFVEDQWLLFCRGTFTGSPKLAVPR